MTLRLEICRGEKTFTGGCLGSRPCDLHRERGGLGVEDFALCSFAIRTIRVLSR